ncbi:MAG: acetylornithine deacetylase [Rhodococcus sp. (in: high G+C Gram-positive bacteria)]
MRGKRLSSTMLSAVPTDRSLEWVKRLIGVDTTSSISNRPLIDLLATEIRRHGVEPILISDATGTKFNLLATFSPPDGTTTGGVMFSGHTDVVPVDNQAWSSDAFVPEIRAGSLYGRGTCDMKSFIGIVTAALPDIVARPLAEPIHFAFSYDEEIGCLGAGSLVDEVVARNLSPRVCVVGEPTGMRVVRAHKSVNVIRVDLQGVSAHSSLTPDGVNAIEYGAELIRFVRNIADELRAHGPFDEAFDVAWTTCSVNLVSGGIAVNTVPQDCSLTFEFRSISAADAAVLLQRFTAETNRIDAMMRAENPSATATMHALAAVPPLEVGANVSAAASAEGWGGRATDEKVAYATEAGMFAAIGVPTVVCGPGSITQAHGPDEFVTLDQLARCEQFVSSVISQTRA